MIEWTPNRKTEAFVFGAIVLGLAMWRFGATVADPDLWGHVQFGIDKIEAGAYLRHDIYSYLTRGTTWFNHEWLAEVVMGGVYLWLGPAGLVVTKAIVAASVVILLAWVLMREGIDPVRATFLMALGVVLLTPTFGTFRPQVFTTLLMTVTLLIIASFHRGHHHLIWALPPLFALWVNLHGGVISGIVVVWVWAAAYALFDRRGRRWVPVLVAALCSLAMLLNPNGLQHVRFLVETTTVSRPEIVEWEAVDLLGPLGIIYLVVVGFLGFALVRSRRELEFALVIPLIGLSVAPLVAGRHLQLFVPAAFILGAPYLAKTLQRGRADQAVQSTAGRALSVLLIVGLVAGSFAVGRVAVASRCLAIDAKQFLFPARAVAAVKDATVEGNAVVPFNWGEYVIWHLGPELKVSGDGRRETIYPEEAHRANIDFANGSDDWDRILEMAPTDWVIQRTGTAGAQLMVDRVGWALEYQDRVATVFTPIDVAMDLVGDDTIPEDGNGLCFPAP